jgi:hypothetical protein
MISSASGVEQPNASIMGIELLLFLWVDGRGLAGLDDGDEYRCSILVVCESIMGDGGTR